LELSQEVSAPGSITVIGGQQYQAIDKTEATTNLVAQDGSTIVIGGLIREDTNKSRTGIPFLSKIPIVGALFGSTTDESKRTELIILLTPRVIRNQIEAGQVTADFVDKYKNSTKDKGIDDFIKEKSQSRQNNGNKPDFIK
jgi:general secretion pathway protein D